MKTVEFAVTTYVRLNVENESHAEECRCHLVNEPPRLGSNWEDLNPQTTEVIVERVE